jgi:tetrapyrrole methylase family protein/MazG family protein
MKKPGSAALPSVEVPAPSPDARALDRVLGLMARLRAPGGCPWDREQTPASLKPQMLEECYEVLEAIDAGAPAGMIEELGDLLLHIVFQAEIAREAGDFTFADVATGLAEKLVRRHPHVFGSEKVADATETIALWDKLKTAEKPERSSALDGVPRALPALMRAEALQKKARKVGFDWPDIHGALDKVVEEIAEVRAEVASADKAGKDSPSREKMAEELGDLFFALVNVTRHLRLDAEELLTAANDKFARRFRAVEERVRAGGKEMKACTLEELDAAWNEVKEEEGK